LPCTVHWTTKRECVIINRSTASLGMCAADARFLCGSWASCWTLKCTVNRKQHWEQQQDPQTVIQLGVLWSINIKNEDRSSDLSMANYCCSNVYSVQRLNSAKISPSLLNDYCLIMMHPKPLQTSKHFRENITRNLPAYMSFWLSTA